LPTTRPKRAVLRRIKLLLLDVDGVMTDGGIYYSSRGEELKRFNTKDGYGIVKLQNLGVRVGIITGRVSKIVEKRAEELGISEVHQNLDDKVTAYRSILERLKLTDAEVAYIGDDEPDVSVLRCAGFSAAPADAVANVLREVDYVCQRKGGKGAVREIVDLILNAQA
jgi:3-deoxy-D-manno-octulosonate 8-phosphate phosphatase (KDO 8-P phosphatase)